MKLGIPKIGSRAMTVLAPVHPRGRLATRGGALALALLALAFAALLSLAVGARSIPLSEVLDALRHGGDTQNAAIVTDLRLPRTLLGIAVGASLGLAGALMQALTRNPFASPSVMGVSSGAAFCVVLAIYVAGIATPLGYVWFAVAGFMVVGVAAGLALARPLNALALGDDAARSLGANVARTRILGAVAITLLCGAATAAAGPIYFLGLTVPHAARAICGPDQRWVLAYSAILGATLLLVADVIGRVLVRPSEVQAGVMVAVIGAPVFIALVRRKRIAAL